MLAAIVAMTLFAADAEPADTIVVCPKEFVAALDPLLAHRHGQGHRFLYVPNTWSPDEIRASIRKTAAGGKLKAVLLVGDAEPAADTDAAIRARCVPAHRSVAKVNVKFGSEPEIGTDNWYADLDDDEVPDLAIGRLPADNSGELSRMVAKILTYETRQSHGPWRQRVNFVAGVGGFGQLIDTVVETSTKKLLTEGIPSEYSTNMTFGSWRSPFCPDPRLFGDTAIARHNEGCLFWVYIGHGHTTGLDNVQVPGSRFHIFDCDDCAKLRADNGSPIAVMLACYTAAYDRGNDCLGEEMLRTAGGPVAVYGGSRVTMPYAMSVMGMEMLDEYFKNRPATLGEVILSAKRRMVTPIDEKNALQNTNRLLVDAIAGVISPARDSLDLERKEHLQLFNLLGDPNLTLSYPQEIKIDLKGEPAPGQTLSFEADCPFAGRATIELLARRDTFKREFLPREHFDPSNAGLAAFQASYQQANDRVWAKRVIDIRPAATSGERLVQELRIPAEAHGPAHLRIFVEGPQGHAVGVVNLTIKAKEKQSE